MSLRLIPHPDIWGWTYGTFQPGDGDLITVNIMPPKTEWRGDTILEGHEPNDAD